MYTEVVLKLKSILGNAIFLSVGDVPEEVGVVQYVVFIQPQVWAHLWPRIFGLVCIHRHLRGTNEKMINVTVIYGNTLVTFCHTSSTKMRHLAVSLGKFNLNFECSTSRLMCLGKLGIWIWLALPVKSKFTQPDMYNMLCQKGAG